MKNFMVLASLVGTLTFPSAARAQSPSVLIENSASCPAQLTEFKQALTMDPKIVKVMPPTSKGYALVAIQDPKKEVNAALRSSGYGLSSWELSPSLDATGNCVPVKAAEIVESVHNWNRPLPLVVGGVWNCRHEVGEILDAQSKRPDLFGGIAGIGRPTSDDALKAALSGGVAGNVGLADPRVFPMMGAIEVIPDVEESGRCKEIKSKEIVHALDNLKKTIEQKAESSALGLKQEKAGNPEDILDSKVAGVKIFVGNM